MAICLDVSDVLLLDGAGMDITPVERGDTVALEVLLVGGADSLLISDALPTNEGGC